MDLKQLSYFLCLAREGNMTRAARQLNIVQPALSMQIAKLERLHGKRLFDRGAHGVTLTSAGEVLAKLAGAVLREVDRANEEMARLDGRVWGRVSIGMIASASQSTLAASSAKIAARYPEVHLLVSEGYTDTLIDWTIAGDIDVAIVNAPRRKMPLAAHHILDERMLVACSAASQQRLPRRVPLSRLNEFDLVIPSRRHGLRMILDDAALEAGLSLTPRMEVDALSAICEIVATTEMVTVLPGVALYPWLANGRLRVRQIDGPEVARTVQWIAHSRRVVSAAAAAVVDIVAADLISAAEAASKLARMRV